MYVVLIGNGGYRCKIPRPHPIRALSGVHIVHIDAGCLHSLALSQATKFVTLRRCPKLSMLEI